MAGSGEAARIGWMGGTFDPPHLGHLAVAETVRDRLELTEVILVPAPSPPHKKGPQASFEDRCRMVEILIRGHPALSLLDVERDLPPPHYTVRTLRHMAAGALEGREIFLIIGADSLEELHTWKDHAELFRLSRVVALTRPGHELATGHLAPKHAAALILLPGLAVNISSTRIRRCLAAGEDPPGVPPAILAYIRERELYRDRPGRTPAPR